MKLKVGDRVAVYVGGARGVNPGRNTGTVISRTDEDGDYFIDFGDGQHWFAHPKQCRRLVKKSRGKIYISCDALNKLLSGETILTSVSLKRDAIVAPIEFIEARKK